METVRISRLYTSSCSVTNSSTHSRISSNSATTNELLPSLRIYKNGPGPGKYSRNSSIGFSNTDITLCKSPAFSIGKALRFKFGNGSQSPGPIYYPIINKNRAPTYYICSRSKDLDVKLRCFTPGPGAYSPEKHQNPFKRSIPSISFSRAARFPSYLA